MREVSAPIGLTQGRIVQAAIKTGNAAESMAAPGDGPPEGGGGGDIKPLRNTKRASAPVKRAEKAGQYQTESALLGPFWRKNAPVYEAGGNISHGPESKQADQLFEVTGHVRDAQGQPYPGFRSGQKLPRLRP